MYTATMVLSFDVRKHVMHWFMVIFRFRGWRQLYPSFMLSYLLFSGLQIYGENACFRSQRIPSQIYASGIVARFETSNWKWSASTGPSRGKIGIKVVNILTE